MPELTTDLIEEAARVQPDRTLSTAFLDPVSRARVIALLLFANEIARARAAVSEPALAMIRLRWWTDVLDQIYGGQIYGGTTLRTHPIAMALAEVIGERALPRRYFQEMIDAHGCEVDAMPFETWDALEHYLDHTQGHLNRLSLLVSGVTSLSTPANDAARWSGIALGLSHLIATLPQWCARRSNWLTADLRANLNLEAMYQGQIEPALGTVLSGIVRQIKDARRNANQAIKTAGLGQSFPVLAPACLASRYAKAQLPKTNGAWTKPAEIALLERQIRLVSAVGLQRV